MTRDRDKTNEELIAEVARLRAQLAVSETRIKDLRELERECRVVCITEIEQLRQARTTLKLANMIVEQSPAVLFRREANESARLVYVSENISQWGYKAEDFLTGQMTFQEIVYLGDQDRMEKELEQFSELSLQEYAQEYRIQTADGRVRWVSDQTSVSCDEDGNAQYNQGILMDITRRKEAEEALSDSEFKFRRTIESAGEGYILLDQDLLIREVNDAYCRMVGYERGELLGKSPIEFATPEYRNFLIANKKRLLAMDYRRFEGAIYHRDGHVVPMLVHGNTLRDADGDFLGNVAFIADISEQKKAVMLAGEVQKSLLPSRSPIVSGVDVAGASLASEVAGGDYFDYLMGHDPENPVLTVVVGDISGHGVDAALLMTSARGFLRMRAAQVGTPAQIVTELNRHLASDLDGTGRFMTLFYLLFDTKNEVARWVRAGHEPAMIYCPVLDTFTILGGDESCLPLGVEHESRYVEQVNDLHPGQIIAIGTDGIWEARNMDGEMFGKERFKQVVRKYCLEKSQVILDEVFKAVRFFTGGATPEDDITLVVVKYGFDE